MEEYGPVSTKTARRKKDKSLFATVDKVLDHRSISVINKLLKREKMKELTGTVSSGKEANVYTALGATSLVSRFIQPGAHMDTLTADMHTADTADSADTADTADTQSDSTPDSDSTPEIKEEAHEEFVPVVLKIYKTSAMLFKDRARYIVDERRFANACTTNPRKLVRLWAEKEVRNLKRLEKHGIPCPSPLYLKESVLVMSMIGEGTPAPRLKDAECADWAAVYQECLQLLRDIYKKTGLVHADFSEYNLLYFDHRVYVIDVGQSIERDQENANTFLVMDIKNCNDFFARKGVAVEDEVAIFESITGLTVPAYLRSSGRLEKDMFIPSRLADVVNKEDYNLFLSQTPRGRTSGVRCAPGGMESDDKCSDEYTEDTSEYPEDTSEYPEDTSEDSESPIGNSGEADSEETKTREMNLFVRRLRLRDPSVTRDEEKEYNRERKKIVKDMNRERRALRALKNDRIVTQKTKKKAKTKNKTKKSKPDLGDDE